MSELEQKKLNDEPPNTFTQSVEKFTEEVTKARDALMEKLFANYDIIKSANEKLEHSNEMLREKCRDLEARQAESNEVIKAFVKELADCHQLMSDQDTKIRFLYSLKLVNLDRISNLKNEIFEKLEEMNVVQDEVKKSLKSKNLKLLEEECEMTKKEVEDLEDSVSKKIQTFHLRRLYMQKMFGNIEKKTIIEKSLSSSVEDVKALTPQIERIRTIVRSTHA